MGSDCRSSGCVFEFGSESRESAAAQTMTNPALSDDIFDVVGYAGFVITCGSHPPLSPLYLPSRQGCGHQSGKVAVGYPARLRPPIRLGCGWQSGKATAGNPARLRQAIRQGYGRLSGKATAGYPARLRPPIRLGCGWQSGKVAAGNPARLWLAIRQGCGRLSG